MANGILPDFKTCPGCKINKPNGDFHKMAGKYDGLQTRCKSCKRAQRLANTNHKEVARAYYEANKQAILAKNAEWAAANKDRKTATNLAWAKANTERIKQLGIINAAQRRATYVAWYAARKHIRVEQNKSWRKANLERVYAKNAERRARAKGSSGTHTAQDVALLMKAQRGRCAHAWCHRSLNEGFHLDHIKPLIKGGSNDRFNLQLLCPHCNLSKGSRDPIDHAQRNGMLL